MGTFYTVNRIHDSKSYSGVYQSVIVVDVDTDKPLEHAPEGAYVARPNEVYFRWGGRARRGWGTCCGVCCGHGPSGHACFRCAELRLLGIPRLEKTASINHALGNDPRLLCSRV